MEIDITCIVPVLSLVHWTTLLKSWVNLLIICEQGWHICNIKGPTPGMVRHIQTGSHLNRKEENGERQALKSWYYDTKIWITLCHEKQKLPMQKLYTLSLPKTFKITGLNGCKHCKIPTNYCYISKLHNNWTINKKSVIYSTLSRNLLIADKVLSNIWKSTSQCSAMSL